MTNKDLISQYVDTGLGIPRYQFDKLSSNDKRTYLRKIEISLDSQPNNIQYYYGDLPEEKQLKVVKDNGYGIRYIKNPSFEVQLEAVRRNGLAIQYIENPSEYIKNEAIISEGDAIKYIPNPTERMKLLAVKRNGFLITLFDNPSHELQMKAFEGISRNNDFDLRYWVDSLVHNGIQICDELQLELVKLDSSFIASIKNQSEEAQMVFVRKAFEEGDKDLLRYLKEPTDNVLRLIIELSNNLNQYKER